MAERRSALAHLSADAGGVARPRISEAQPGAILMLQAWPDTLATVEAVVTQTLKADLPALGHGVPFDGGTILAIGAGRFLLAVGDAGAGKSFREAFSTSDAAVTDISHGRTVLRLEGDAAEELLQHAAPVDFGMKPFPPGRVAQTAIHHVDVVVHRTSEASFEVWALRSFAESLLEWLIDAGADLGAGSMREK